MVLFKGVYICKYMIIGIAGVNDQHASAQRKRGGGDLSQIK